MSCLMLCFAYPAVSSWTRPIFILYSVWFRLADWSSHLPNRIDQGRKGCKWWVPLTIREFPRIVTEDIGHRSQYLSNTGDRSRGAEFSCYWLCRVFVCFYIPFFRWYSLVHWIVIGLVGQNYSSALDMLHSLSYREACLTTWKLFQLSSKTTQIVHGIYLGKGICIP